jgi:hypothetical protein
MLNTASLTNKELQRNAISIYLDIRCHLAIVVPVGNISLRVLPLSGSTQLEGDKSPKSDTVGKLLTR